MDDKRLTIAEIASLHQFAGEEGTTYHSARHFADKWPDCCIRIGAHLFIIRDRMKARMADVDLRPHSRKTPKPRQPQCAAGEGGHATD